VSTFGLSHSGINRGAPEDRTREQFTARITRHPKGKPGHAYLAEDIAYIRADTLGELQALVADFAWDADDAA
jgi:hypothetical protein